MSLTINEVASRLKLSVETIHRWVRQGKIPMRRSGETYTIRAEMLERWANEAHVREHRCRASVLAGNELHEDPGCAVCDGAGH